MIIPKAGRASKKTIRNRCVSSDSDKNDVVIYPSYFLTVATTDLKLEK